MSFLSLPGVHWHPLSSGLSGAKVWRGELAGTSVAVLKRYPASMTIAKLQAMHIVMTTARQALGPVIPTVLHTTVQPDLIDVQTWMTGTPGTAADVDAGLQFLRRWHAVFAPQSVTVTPAPGLAARLQVLRNWDTTEARAVVQELLPWQSVTRRCHTIHGDLHREHLLFSEGTVSGMIDFAATRIDDPLLDVARWLGDVGSPAHLELWGEDLALLKVLIRASLLCSVMNWRTNPAHPRAVQVHEAWQRWL
jgi:Phosphotransferase enzyme family